MQKHSLPVQRTAHYYTLGQPGPRIQRILLACHGYGQAAERFIHKFRGLDDGATLIIVPEGLSRFYWGGLDGEVVASWMTRGDRLDEIVDYSRYLSQLLNGYLEKCPEEARLVLLGFSQGCATIMRWAVRAYPRASHLVFWAGSIPEDIDYQPHMDYLSGRELHTFVGDEDPFLTPDRLEWHRNMLADKRLQVIEHTFSGKHTILRSVLEEWFAKLRG